MSAKKQAAPEKAVHQASVPDVSARIDRLMDRENNSIKAIASVNIGGAFAVHGIKVIESQKGLFVSMPSNSYTDTNGKTQYSDICHPVTADARNALIGKVTEAYEQAIAERQAEAEAESEDESEDISKGTKQSM